MGTAQSTEEEGKCPLPGRPFQATPNNVVLATQRGKNRRERIERSLLPEEEPGDSVLTKQNQEEVSKQPDMRRMNENGDPLGPSTELKEWRTERPSGVENPSEEDRERKWGNLLSLKGGMKAIKKLKVKEIREILKENRIKITHKGKYLNKKQMLNKLKMIKWN
jgi:hypothetical protein